MSSTPHLSGILNLDGSKPLCRSNVCVSGYRRGHPNFALSNFEDNHGRGYDFHDPDLGPIHFPTSEHYDVAQAQFIHNLQPILVRVRRDAGAKDTADIAGVKDLGAVRMASKTAEPEHYLSRGGNQRLVILDGEIFKLEFRKDPSASWQESGDSSRFVELIKHFRSQKKPLHTMGGGGAPEIWEKGAAAPIGPTYTASAPPPHACESSFKYADLRLGEPNPTTFNDQAVNMHVVRGVENLEGKRVSIKLYVPTSERAERYITQTDDSGHERVLSSDKPDNVILLIAISEAYDDKFPQNQLRF